MTGCWARWMILILLGVILSTLGCVEKPEQKTEMVLSNYPELFEKDVIIVIGENVTQIEMEGAQAIAENLLNLTGNEPVIKEDVEITGDELAGHNLILVGSADSNEVLKEVYDMTDAMRVTEEYPGAGKGVLEILRNPWDSEKAVLLVAGSDELGMKAGSMELRTDIELCNKSALVVEIPKRISIPLYSIVQDAYRSGEPNRSVDVAITFSEKPTEIQLEKIQKISNRKLVQLFEDVYSTSISAENILSIEDYEFIEKIEYFGGEIILEGGE
jgi:S-layer like family, outer domain